MTDGFSVITQHHDDDPDGLTPNTRRPVGAGVNLCNPAVVSPNSTDQCAGRG